MPRPPQTVRSATLTISGADRVFLFLDTIDKYDFMDAHHAFLKRKLAENLKLAGAGPAQVLADLSAFDDEYESFGHGHQDEDKNSPGNGRDSWVRWLNHREGKCAAMRISLLKTYEPDEVSAILRQVADEPALSIMPTILKLFGDWITTKPQEESEPAPGSPTGLPPDACYGDGGADPNAPTPMTTAA